ncbi:unnamed protein product [Mytilus edulis]|uniref:AAA+ ATPase domain-containing protein n=1 Tax=Mytilus edulis TaxID=6550 RepID=A0A8S3RMR9_MYTED|nr:unnamed protein product [Mytilus edulis]
MSLVKFQTPMTSICVGPTGSGKTTYIKRLLENAQEMFTIPPQKIYYCYSIWQDVFDELKKTVSNISFQLELPDESDFLVDKDIHTLWIIDDKMDEVVDCKLMQKIYCVLSHHTLTSIIFILKNLYQKGKVMRSISLNSHVFFLFKNGRDSLQIQSLARQMFPGQVRFFMDVYQRAISRPYNCLIVDIAPGSNPEYQLRANPFPGEDTIVYQPK